MAAEQVAEPVGDLPVKEKVNKRGPRHRHPLFATWKGMVARCHSERHAGFRNFGARGISVCKRWREDFWAFAGDVGERPEGAVLRIKDRSQGFYGPGNWEWHRGTKWETEGVCRNTVRSRILAGWDPVVAAIQLPRGTGGMEVRVLATGLVKGVELRKVAIAAGPLRDCWRKVWECVRLCLRHRQSCRFDVWKGHRKRLVSIKVE